MIDAQQAQQAVETHGSLTKAARALGVSRSAMTDAMVRAGLYAKPGAAKAPEAAFSPAQVNHRRPLGLEAFRQQYDKSYIIPKRIEEALQKLGSDGWLHEMDFAQLAGVNLQDLGNFRSAFEDFVVVVRRDGKRVWAGSTEFAQQLRECV